MKKLFYKCLFTVLFLTGTAGLAQPPAVIFAPPSQCYTVQGNSAVASVLPGPPGIASYSWAYVGGTGTCVPIINSMSPNGSMANLQFFCCGAFSINCTAYNPNNIPVSNAIYTYTVFCPPSVTISSSPSGTTFCAGTTLSLSAFGANTYTWQPGNIVSSSNIVTPTASICYTLTGSTGSNCDGSDTKCVTIQIAGTLAVSSPTQNICNGSGATFTASGATSYSWSTGITTATISVTPSVNTTYTVTGNPGNCSSTNTVSVLVKPNPSVAVNSSTLMLCKGSSATLTASGASVYSWANSTVTIASLVVSPTISTTYSVTGTGTNNCIHKVAYTQSVTTCTGIDEGHVGDGIIKIFPNPNTGIVNIALTPLLPDAFVEICNMLGEIILRQKLDSELTTINIKKLDQGFYYFNTTNGKNKIVFKVLKE